MPYEFKNGIKLPDGTIVDSSDDLGSSPSTTKGDLEVHNGTALTRLPVGTDDYILSADSAEATGLKWIENTGGTGGSGTTINIGAFSGASVWKSTDQTAIPSATFTKVTFDTIEYDTDSLFDDTNDRFVADTASYYRFTVNLRLDTDSNDNQDHLVRIYKNGSVWKDVIRTDGNTGGSIVNVNGSFDVYLEQGDYLETYVYISGGTTRDINLGQASTWMSIHKLYDVQSAQAANSTSLGFHGAKVELDTDVTNVTSATPISWDVEVYDTQDFWDAGNPDYFTMPADGTYEFSVGTHWHTVREGRTYIKVDTGAGFTYYGGDYSSIISDSNLRMASVWTFSLSAGDKVQIEQYGLSGAVKTLYGNSSNYYTVRRIDNQSAIIAQNSYTETIGDGTTTQFTINHNLGVPVLCQVLDTSLSPPEYITIAPKRIDSNNLRLDFPSAPATDSIEVMVYAGGDTSTRSFTGTKVRGDATAQTAPATWTKLVFQDGTSGGYESGLTWDATNNRLVCVTAGTYQVFGSAQLSTANANNYLAIYKNGVQEGSNVREDDVIVKIFGSMELAVDDYLELWAYSSSSYTYNFPQFEAYLLGQASLPSHAHTATADTDWHVVGDPGEPAFENGWANRGDPSDKPLRFRKTEDGFVHVNGQLDPSSASGTAAIFTLPVGYRTDGAVSFPQSCVGGGGYNEFYVLLLPDGTVNHRADIDFAFSTSHAVYSIYFSVYAGE